MIEQAKKDLDCGAVDLAYRADYVYLFPTLQLVTGWSEKSTTARSIYTMKIGNCYQ
jgi:hypothetical protein